jgi:hypothetical protein
MDIHVCARRASDDSADLKEARSGAVAAVSRATAAVLAQVIRKRKRE